VTKGGEGKSWKKSEEMRAILLRKRDRGENSRGRRGREICRSNVKLLPTRLRSTSLYLTKDGKTKHSELDITLLSLEFE